MLKISDKDIKLTKLTKSKISCKDIKLTKSKISDKDIKSTKSKISDKDIKKQRIIKLFFKNIKNKKINLKSMNKNHKGAEGYWLETQMGIKHNSKNNPDIFGYEMKKIQKKLHLVILVHQNIFFLKINQLYLNLII